MVRVKGRTFSADSGDKFVVAYYEGDGLGAPGGESDWFNDPSFGNGEMVDSANPRYEENWTELLRGSARNTFATEHFDLPDGDILYLAFWLDNGDHDFGKFDNVLVMANPRENPVPEPSTWALAMLGAAGIAVVARRRKKA